ncbi:MAG: hypothetical protein HQL66_12770 [Magnetococcales bacterium]|nr:hypothetical protein [Magnetococcales bacterium]
MLHRVHPAAGAVAMLLIVTFWLATFLSELFASQTVVIAVKIAIPWGFLFLVPALATTGGSGIRLARSECLGLVGLKKRRIRLVAVNGLLVLIPAAIYLADKAKTGEFDMAFYLVQILELVVGGVNLTLLGLNMRDGFRVGKGPGDRST